MQKMLWSYFLKEQDIGFFPKDQFPNRGHVRIENPDIVTHDFNRLRISRIDLLAIEKQGSIDHADDKQGQQQDCRQPPVLCPLGGYTQGKKDRRQPWQNVTECAGQSQIISCQPAQNKTEPHSDAKQPGGYPEK